MATTAEEKTARIEQLKNTLDLLKQAEIDKLKPQQRQFALSGFCLGRYHEDIIYQMSYNFGRDIIIEITNFLKTNDPNYYDSLLKHGDK